MGKVNFGVSVKIALIAILLCSSLLANETEHSFKYTNEVRKKLDAIKELAPEDYFKEIDSYRSTIAKYIKHKTGVCTGDFSTFVLNDSGKKSEKKKLSKEERKLCFREMKALQITYINNMYSARKRYLDYLHKVRIENLNQSKKSTIENLQKKFSRRGL